MASIAGLDVPYGSSIQIVRTNILVADAAANPTAAAAANLLTFFNQQMAQDARGKDGLSADYVAVDTVSPTGSAHLVHDASSATNNLPVTKSGASYQVLAVLAASAIEFQGASFATPAKVVLAPASGSIGNDLNGRNLADMADGKTTTLDLTEVFTDVAAATGGTVDLTAGGSLGTSFVEKGNTAGTTPTDATVAADSCALISVFSLCAVTN